MEVGWDGLGPGRTVTGFHWGSAGACPEAGTFRSPQASARRPGSNSLHEASQSLRLLRHNLQSPQTHQGDLGSCVITGTTVTPPCSLPREYFRITAQLALLRVNLQSK